MNEKTSFQGVKKIGVCSDFHIPIRAKEIPAKLLEQFKDVDVIICAGDLVNLEPIHALEKLAPVVVVFGNMDPPEVASQLPEKILLTVNNFKIGITHGSGSPEAATDEAFALFDEKLDCLIHGHSHVPKNEVERDTLVFNPGSSTCNNVPHNTFGILTVNDKITGELFEV